MSEPGDPARPAYPGDPSIRRRVVRAVGANGLSSGLAKIVSLLSTLVLARLLAPEDFGLMALATTVTGVIGLFNEVGIGAAIVQRPILRPEAVDGCFGIALIASAALCALAVALSWPAAAFFKLPALQPVLAVLAFGFFFAAANSVPLALLRREMRFQAVLWAGFACVVVQSATALLFGALGYRHWAIVAGFFAGQLVETLWFWRVSPWRPRWPLPLAAGRELLGYGLHITATRVVWHLYMNADKAIVGRLMNAHAVGVYDVSRSLAGLPTAQIAGLVVGIAAPVYARVQDEPARLQAVQLRLTRGVAYLTFPLLLGLAVLAGELVAVLLGPAWHEAVLPLRALCAAEMVASIANLQSQLLVSTGHVRRLLRYNLLCAAAMPLAVAAGAWADGLRGVALAWMSVYPLLALWLLNEALGVSKLRYRDFWRAVRQPLIGALAMAAALLGLRLAFDGGWPGAPMALRLAAGIGVGALAYLSYLVAIDREGVAEVRQVLADIGVPAAALQRWPFVRGGGGPQAGERKP